jgi:hypothetical protein
MGAGVFGEIEPVDGCRHHPPRGLLERRELPGQGEDGTVVVGVDVQIEEMVTASPLQRVEDAMVPTLADVDDAFEDRVIA